MNIHHPGLRDTQASTPSGRLFDLADPKAEDIHWPDIAEMLAKQARFNGATRGAFYSVAEHSLRVSHMVPPHAAAYALLHDAHEAFTGDHIRPFQRALSEASRTEILALQHQIDSAIHEAADLEWPPSQKILAEVSRADDAQLAIEIGTLLHPHPDTLPPDGLFPASTWQAVAELFLQELHWLLPHTRPAS